MILHKLCYFYNREAERLNFLKVPEILVDEKNSKDCLLKPLSTVIIVPRLR